MNLTRFRHSHPEPYRRADAHTSARTARLGSGSLALLAAALIFPGCAGPPPSHAGDTPGGGTATSPGTTVGRQPQTAERTITVTPADARRIGQKIWQNEAAGSVAGLTSWNKGEAFASMGIGHFIWYPAAVPQTYQESFRPLLAFLHARGVSLPAGITPHTSCPWATRNAFQADAQSPRMRALRSLLQNTIGLQTEFIIQRMQAALPKMIHVAPSSYHQRIRSQFYAISGTPIGLYALIDYVNFKGEGVNLKERYRGQGWGLLQVLQGMQGQPRGQAAAREFAASAKRTLARRIANAAPKNENQWRAGWFRRCDTYAQPW